MMMMTWLGNVNQARRFVVIEEGDGVASRCVTQPNSAGGLGGAVSPPAGSGAEPQRQTNLATIY